MGEPRSGAARWVRLGALALLSLTLAVLMGCQPARLRAPVYGGDSDGNYPDPSIVYSGGWYYAYSTTSFSSPPRRIQVIKSRDLASWEHARVDVAQEALASTPAWARAIGAGGEFWAPTVAQFGSRWVMYFGAKHENVSPTQPGWCIGYATASTPAGPFTPGSSPLFCQVTSQNQVAGLSGSPGTNRGAIDPQVYTTPAGNHYLHFKALDNMYQLRGVKLSADGRSTTGSAHGLFSIPAQADVWEYSHVLHFTVLENPSMDFNPSTETNGFNYYLYYSGGEWTQSSYATGVAACKHPLGPCFRATADEPWLASRGSAAGPGGLSVFRGVGGQRWVAYHSWEANAVHSQGRRLHVEPLGYDGITPVLLNRQPTGSFNALVTANPGEVRFRGAADDADTGRPTRIRIVEGDDVIYQDPTECFDRHNPSSSTCAVGPDKKYDLTQAPIVPGNHRYCVSVADDNGGSRVSLGCVTVTVAGAAGPAAPVTTAPPPGVTSVPPTTLAPTAVPSTTGASAT